MSEVDYKKLGNLSLEDSGLLSLDSVELKESLVAQKIKNVSDFLKCVDNNTFKGYKYRETLMEAQGLARLLKQKYLNIPLGDDINFAAPIKYMSFDEIFPPVWLYGVQINRNERINIYSLITKLGFNSLERDKILNVSEDSLEGTLFIDLLYNTYVTMNKYGGKDQNNKILAEKLLIILKYYLIHYKEDFHSKFMVSFYAGMEEFHDLLIKKPSLEESNDMDSKNDDNVIKR